MKQTFKMAEFSYDFLILSNDDPQRKYYRRTNESKKAVAWGQRKLLLIELEFFSLFWNPTTLPHPIIIYAGAAPGKHISYLSSLFPEFTFHLWDPRPFDLQESTHIKIYQDYFTDETAKLWANRNDVFFISDIRTADYRQLSTEDNEKQILADMYRQQHWHQIINPVSSLLKFRLPYSGTNAPMKISYLNGTLLKQPWAPQTSTETRMVPSSGFKEWDALVYEEQMFHFNTIVRETLSFQNPFTFDSSPIDPPELLNDFDSLAEVHILLLYLKLRQHSPTKENAISLSQQITQEINRGKPFTDSLHLLRNNTGLIKHRNEKPQKKIIVKRKK